MYAASPSNLDLPLDGSGALGSDLASVTSRKSNRTGAPRTPVANVPLAPAPASAAVSLLSAPTFPEVTSAANGKAKAYLDASIKWHTVSAVQHVLTVKPDNPIAALANHLLDKSSELLTLHAPATAVLGKGLTDETGTAIPAAAFGDTASSHEYVAPVVREVRTDGRTFELSCVRKRSFAARLYSHPVFPICCIEDPVNVLEVVSVVQQAVIRDEKRDTPVASVEATKARKRNSVTSLVPGSSQPPTATPAKGDNAALKLPSTASSGGGTVLASTSTKPSVKIVWLVPQDSTMLLIQGMAHQAREVVRRTSSVNDIVAALNSGPKPVKQRNPSLSDSASEEQPLQVLEASPEDTLLAALPSAVKSQASPFRPWVSHEFPKVLSKHVNVLQDVIIPLPSQKAAFDAAFCDALADVVGRDDACPLVSIVVVSLFLPRDVVSMALAFLSTTVAPIEEVARFRFNAELNEQERTFEKDKLTRSEQPAPLVNASAYWAQVRDRRESRDRGREQKYADMLKLLNPFPQLNPNLTDDERLAEEARRATETNNRKARVAAYETARHSALIARASRRSKEDVIAADVQKKQRDYSVSFIQAVIRGFLARRRVRPMIHAKREEADEDGDLASLMVSVHSMRKVPRSGRQPSYVNTSQWVLERQFADELVTKYNESLTLNPPTKWASARTYTTWIPVRQRLPAAFDDDVSSEEESWEVRARLLKPKRQIARRRLFHPQSRAQQAMRDAASEIDRHMADLQQQFLNISPLNRQAYSYVWNRCLLVANAAFLELVHRGDIALPKGPRPQRPSLMGQLTKSIHLDLRGGEAAAKSTLPASSADVTWDAANAASAPFVAWLRTSFPQLEARFTHAWLVSASIPRPVPRAAPSAIPPATSPKGRSPLSALPAIVVVNSAPHEKLSSLSSNNSDAAAAKITATSSSATVVPSAVGRRSVTRPSVTEPTTTADANKAPLTSLLSNDGAPATSDNAQAAATAGQIPSPPAPLDAPRTAESGPLLPLLQSQFIVASDPVDFRAWLPAGSLPTSAHAAVVAATTSSNASSLTQYPIGVAPNFTTRGPSSQTAPPSVDAAGASAQLFSAVGGGAPPPSIDVHRSSEAPSTSSPYGSIALTPSHSLAAANFLRIGHPVALGVHPTPTGATTPSLATVAAATTSSAPLATSATMSSAPSSALEPSNFPHVLMVHDSVTSDRWRVDAHMVHDQLKLRNLTWISVSSALLCYVSKRPFVALPRHERQVAAEMGLHSARDFVGESSVSTAAKPSPTNLPTSPKPEATAFPTSPPPSGVVAAASAGAGKAVSRANRASSVRGPSVAVFSQSTTAGFVATAAGNAALMLQSQAAEWFGVNWLLLEDRLKDEIVARIDATEGMLQYAVASDALHHAATGGLSPNANVIAQYDNLMDAVRNCLVDGTIRGGSTRFAVMREAFFAPKRAVEAAQAAGQGARYSRSQGPTLSLAVAAGGASAGSSATSASLDPHRSGGKTATVAASNASASFKLPSRGGAGGANMMRSRSSVVSAGREPSEFASHTGTTAAINAATGVPHNESGPSQHRSSLASAVSEPSHVAGPPTIGLPVPPGGSDRGSFMSISAAPPPLPILDSSASLVQSWQQAATEALCDLDGCETRFARQPMLDVGGLPWLAAVDRLLAMSFLACSNDSPSAIVVSVGTKSDAFYAAAVGLVGIAVGMAASDRIAMSASISKPGRSRGGPAQTASLTANMSTGGFRSPGRSITAESPRSMKPTSSFPSRPQDEGTFRFVQDLATRFPTLRLMEAATELDAILTASGIVSLIKDVIVEAKYKAQALRGNVGDCRSAIRLTCQLMERYCWLLLIAAATVISPPIVLPQSAAAGRCGNVSPLPLLADFATTAIGQAFCDRIALMDPWLDATAKEHPDPFHVSYTGGWQRWRAMHFTAQLI